jgi:hypothetical protein
MAKDTNMPALGAPLVLLATLWGAVGSVLSAFSIINDRRDKIFALIEECGRCDGKLLGPLELYVTNLLPLSLGICLFLLIVAVIVIQIPSFMNCEDSVYLHRTKYAAWSIASLPLFCLFGFFAGAIFDAWMVLNKLSYI